MLLFLFLILPSAACFFCLLQNIVFSRRTRTHVIFQLLLATVGIYVMAESICAAPAINLPALGFARLVELTAALCIVPLSLMYLHKLAHGTRFVSWQYLWLILPVFFLTTGILLHDLSGSPAIAVFLRDYYLDGSAAASRHNGDAVYFYYVFTVIIFRAVLALEAILALGYIVWQLIKEKLSLKALLRFVRKGTSVSVLELQLYSFILPLLIILTKVILPVSFLNGHIWIGPALAVITTCSILSISFTSLFGAKEYVSVGNMSRALLYNFNPDIKSKIVKSEMKDIIGLSDEEELLYMQKMLDRRIPKKEEEKEKEDTDNSTALSEQLFATMAGTWDEESLLARFQNLVVRDKLFLQPGLSIIEVADKLHSNKTYVSKLVNNTYNMGFPELLNTLRIDYAEQYILNHKEAKQDEIAEACGFLSASSFNSIFKKVKGMTPGAWLSGINKKDFQKNI